MPLRLLARAAPLVLAAVAAAIWARRRRIGRLALPPAPLVEPVRPVSTGRFVRTAPNPVKAAPRRRAPQPIDIVSIGDDLLLSARN